MKYLGRMMSVVMVLACGCGDDATEADRLGVGAACTASATCETVDEIELECLTQFTGGYCGLEGCEADADCPEGSACVIEGGDTFCYRLCLDKPECNLNRPADVEANCVGSIDFVEPRNDRKACEPPSAGL